MQNKLFTECQLCFIPGNLCITQLLSITHEIYKSFDCNPLADMKIVKDKNCSTYELNNNDLEL